MRKGILLNLVMALQLILIITGCSNSNLNNIDNDFRRYLNENYDVELADKSTVNHCKNNCDYFGFYPLKNDLTYAIQISKTGNEYEVSYDNQAVQMRKELYNYISLQKGNNYVENYLKFYDNGDIGHVHFSSISRNQLSYIVYYDSNINIENQIYSDYQILEKANNIMNSNTKSYIKEMEVFYIKDDRIKEKNWLENLKIDVYDYGFAPSYLDGDKEIATTKFTYHYRISNYKNDAGLKNLSFEEFKKLVKTELESK